MAEFCKACSIEIFGEDYKDFASQTKSEEWQQGLAATALCEGCGIIQVDPEGNCVSKDCLCAGKQGHGLSWITELKSGPPT